MQISVDCYMYRRDKGLLKMHKINLIVKQSFSDK